MRSVPAVILIGGLGTRLRPLTIGTPKPLLPTAGVPFLAHQLARAAESGVGRVVLATAYRSEMFAEVFARLGNLVRAFPLAVGTRATAHRHRTPGGVRLDADVVAEARPVVRRRHVRIMGSAR